eukprot:TRINITY_DN88362_c0_g1_i1.p1 TRINITY_DN88362_c0_g1~~TRINITY_DN88362_c0_g1_i1.p1  ORF type:complete len:535 (-),score=81.93 TRINITY_DN88362_c0_g1_i1:62-1609(-)
MADPASDGWPAGKVFDGPIDAYTFDDIMFLPGHSSGRASDIDLAGHITKNIKLRAPIIGAPSDTVTEVDMSVALALNGGIGIIHANQSIEAQCAMVKRVKRHVGGFIQEPFTLGPDNTVEDLAKLGAEHGIGTALITETGSLGSRLMGVVTSRDIDNCADPQTKLSHIMTKNVRTAREPESGSLTLQDAMNILKSEKVGKLPVLSADGSNLVSLLVRSDLKKIRENPQMSKDLQGKLLVGAAVPALADGSGDWARASKLCEAGADLIYLFGDGHDSQLELLQKIKSTYRTVDVLAGPAASTREARRLVEAGADGVVAGAGCDSGGDPHHFRPVSVGRGDATTVYEVAQYAAMNLQIPVVAAGVRNSSQALIALGLGASGVLLREPLAGTDEAPRGGGASPAYHHSNSLSAQVAVRTSIPRSSDRMAPVSRNVAMPVSHKGSVKAYMLYLLSGLRSGMRDLGFGSLQALHEGLEDESLRMECRLPFSSQLRESCSQMAKKAIHPEVMPVSLSALGR